MKRALIAISCITLYQQAVFASYTIDGDLSDWGVTPFTGWNWTPTSPTADHIITDNVDTYNTFPGNGLDPSDPDYEEPDYSEPFDIEAVYFDDDQDNIYGAIVTSYTDSHIGDIFFDLNGDMAVDLHGQTTGLDAALRVGSSNLISYKFLTSLPKTAVEVIGKNATNELGTNTTYRDEASDGEWRYQGSPYRVDDGDLLGDGQLAYQDYLDIEKDAGYDGYKTRIFEFSIARNILNDPNVGDKIGVHFTMWCGNDSANLFADIDYEKPIPPVPAPSAAILAGLGAMIVSRIKKCRNC